jgi:hypothetical protein
MLSEFGYWTTIHQPATLTRFELLFELLAVWPLKYIRPTTLSAKLSEIVIYCKGLLHNGLESIQIRNVIKRLVWITLGRAVNGIRSAGPAILVTPKYIPRGLALFEWYRDKSSTPKRSTSIA